MISAFIAGLATLWLPILVSAVIVFLASSVIHMGPLWHRGDYPQMPREAEVMAALRPLAIPPGDYLLPRAKDMKEYKTAEFTAKIAQGPVVVMTVMPNAPVAMGKSLARSGSCSSLSSAFSWRWSPATNCPREHPTCACSSWQQWWPSWAIFWRCASCPSGTGAPGD